MPPLPASQFCPESAQSYILFPLVFIPRLWCGVGSWTELRHCSCRIQGGWAAVWGLGCPVADLSQSTDLLQAVPLRRQTAVYSSQGLSPEAGISVVPPSVNTHWCAGMPRHGTFDSQLRPASVRRVLTVGSLVPSRLHPRLSRLSPQARSSLLPGLICLRSSAQLLSLSEPLLNLYFALESTGRWQLPAPASLL